MKKTVLFAMVVLMGSLAMAGTTQIGSATAPKDASSVSTAEILSTLIANASSLQVEGDEKASLSDILGSALAVAHLGQTGSSVVINNVSGHCEVEDVGKFGEVYLNCSLNITDGDYKRTRNGYQGPQLESSTSIIFEGRKSIAHPEYKLSIPSKKVSIQRAG